MKTYEERTQAVVKMVDEKKKRRKAVIASVSTVVPCLVVMALSLVLFLPYQAPDAGAYQKVADAVYSMEYHNNWETWTNELADGLGARKSSGLDYAVSDDVPNGAVADNAASHAPGKAAEAVGGRDSAMEQGAAQPTEQYIENTNLQVMDVKEGDVLKESTHYFYRLRKTHRTYGEQTPSVDPAYSNDALAPADYYGYHYNYYSTGLRLDVYRKAGLDTECVGTYTYDLSQKAVSVQDVEMYLNDDCTAVTILIEDDWANETHLLSVDVSDPADMRLLASKIVSGDYVSSRMVGERLLVYTYYRDYDYTFEEPETYIPYVEENDRRTYTDADDIVCPESAYSMQFDVLTMFDASLTPIGQVAMLGYDQNAVLYVNASRAYLAARESTWRSREGAKGDYTYITCVEWGQQFRVAGNLEIYGVVEDQYWMDEYEGVFRVAASTYTNTDDRTIKFVSWGWAVNASLYCYRVSDWTLVGKVENFAPEGESVQSARFMGAKAYVCTAEIIRFTDPVYCFDLSDYAHITYTDTGAIDGYSTSLIPFADGTLLGVGKLSYGTLKVELYREEGQEVVSVASVTLGGEVCDQQDRLVRVEDYVGVETYKSFLIDATDGVFGMPCYATTYFYSAEGYYQSYEDKPSYLLFTFRDGTLRLAEAVLFEGGVDSYTRAAVSDGFIYLFGTTTFKVLPLTDLE